MNLIFAASFRWCPRGGAALVLLLLVGVVVSAGCGRSSVSAGDRVAGANGAPRPVALATVEPARVAPPVMVPGMLVRRWEAALSFKIGGVVESVAVRPGEAVRAGEELARLDLGEIDAAVARARAAVEKARRDVARAVRLRADEVITAQEADNARTALEVAEADLRAAEFNRRHAVVLAPADGRILRRMAEPGELLAAGQPVVEFGAEEGGWIVRARVPERSVRRLRADGAAEVIFAGEPTIALAARIERVAEAVAPGTGTVEVELAIAPPAEAGLRSGAIGTVRFAGAEVPWVAVPATALREGAGRAAAVMVLDDGGQTVRRHAVEVEALWGERALLAATLPVGAQVVALGAGLVRDGDWVRPVPAPRF